MEMFSVVARRCQNLRALARAPPPPPTQGQGGVYAFMLAAGSRKL